jgi:hypothetical protein
MAANVEWIGERVKFEKLPLNFLSAVDYYFMLKDRTSATILPILC